MSLIGVFYLLRYFNPFIKINQHIHPRTPVALLSQQCLEDIAEQENWDMKPIISSQIIGLLVSATGQMAETRRHITLFIIAPVVQWKEISP